MVRSLTLLLFYFAVCGFGAQGEKNEDQYLIKMFNQTEKLSHVNKSASIALEMEEKKLEGEKKLLQPTTISPEDELDNQENILSQLLDDYDKVKTVSSGSDCVCRCVVRPIKRSDCSRNHDSDPSSPPQDYYTVETITKGSDCKQCVCLAPPSAVNPCEGDYRLKKLQEASQNDIKLATIIDLLEGSLYGLDLLKLNSVTTKLLTRVDNMEKAFARNFTEIKKEKERLKERAKEKDKEKKAQQKKKKVSDLELSGTKGGGTTNTNKQKNYESQLKKTQQQDDQEEPAPARNETETQKSGKEKNSVVIRGVTFYKAEEENHMEDGEHKIVRGRNEDLMVSDKTSFVKTFLNNQKTSVISTPTRTKDSPTITKTKSTSSSIKRTDEVTSSFPKQVASPMTTNVQEATTTSRAIQPTTHPELRSASSADTNISPSIRVFPTAPSQPRPRSRLSWTESPADQPKITKRPGVCKDTVASISEPVQQNSYGLSDGAWMRDARGHGNIIYLTNGHYGDTLLEFRDMDTFKTGQASNSYKLHYSFTGTGHVVYNGAFYYNRAFSRDIIRYDLRHRVVSAWTTLHDALLEEQVHRTQTEVEFAVDESGLWLLYPALDTEGFHQEVILLIHLQPRDLQPIRTFRTGLRRGRYGVTFLVCGVLYAVNSMEHRYANVTYAFDTHTLTHTVPSLAFTNVHTHTSQVAYCPLDKKLYAWDGGNQMMYDVIFAY